MKKLMLILTLSISGVTVFAQNATTEAPKIDDKAIITKGGQAINTPSTASDPARNMIVGKKLKDRKITVVSDALMQTSAVPDAKSKEEEK